MPEFETMLYEKAGSFLSPVKNVAVIKFNRLEAYNSINDQFLLDLNAALDEALNDPDVRSIVLATNHDKAYSAGADLKSAQSLLGAEHSEEVKEAVSQGQQIINKIASMGKPVIAAIHGLCLAGGLEIALACDIRICSTESKMGAVEVGVGLIPAWGGCVRLPRIIGHGKAMEMILTGSQISADEALACGLVSKVVPPEELLSQAMWYGAKLGGNAPVAMKWAKEATNLAFDEDLDDNMEFEVKASVECFKTKDMAAGITAVFEKRRGKFTGE